MRTKKSSWPNYCELRISEVQITEVTVYTGGFAKKKKSLFLISYAPCTDRGGP
jgi:hypothetical protein